MDRRAFLRAGAAASLPAPGILLSGCGGGSSSEPQPQCQGGAFGYSLGLNPASTQILETIEPVTAISFSSVSSSSSTTVGNIDPYVNWSDPNTTAGYGIPFGQLPPVDSQGQLGSCVAWGVGYAATSFLTAMTTGLASQVRQSQVSPADLYAKTIIYEASMGNRCGNGTLIKDALDIMVVQGAASWATSPYTALGCVAPAAGYFYLDGYNRISVVDRAAIRRALGYQVALPFGMYVYQDFESVRGQIYSHPNDGSCPVGAHCMAVVGYDDQRQAYRIQNSWGTAWGDAGFCWMAYETFERITTEVYSPYLSPSTPGNFVPSSSASSGSVTTRNAFGRTFINPASGRFDTVWFSFRISEPILTSSYRLLFYPGSATTPIVLGAKARQQYVRGMLTEWNIQDDSYLRGVANGFFALNVQGRSIANAPVDLTIFASYPLTGQ